MSNRCGKSGILPDMRAIAACPAAVDAADDSDRLPRAATFFRSGNREMWPWEVLEAGSQDRRTGRFKAFLRPIYGVFQSYFRAHDQFTETGSPDAVPYGSRDREQSHVLFNILLIYS